MDKKVKRYFQLKRKQKEIEQEMAELRGHILNHCSEQSVSELETEKYRVKVIHQERKEYDEGKLFEAVPDLEVWRLLSKPDTSKIAGLVKLNVLDEEKLKDTYAVKNITLLQVDKK
ncbi:hypothetical protein [Paenibacillus montanisoli]|uniref:hypothetical protein n=1 Tax=Paenibacillus montanisoli TaxID=2081970 RepID=UPI001F0C5806|nr:hypothetical protein [Paenibacillus montanisoli]